MSTVVIQIGNSDDKLSQAEWSEFVSYVRDAVGQYSEQIHFDGGSKIDAPWQNVCFVSEVSPSNQVRLLDHLRRIRAEYRQESVAVTVGETEFV